MILMTHSNKQVMAPNYTQSKEIWNLLHETSKIMAKSVSSNRL